MQHRHEPDGANSGLEARQERVVALPVVANGVGLLAAQLEQALEGRRKRREGPRLPGGAQSGERSALGLRQGPYQLHWHPHRAVALRPKTHTTAARHRTLAQGQLLEPVPHVRCDETLVVEALNVESWLASAASAFTGRYVSWSQVARPMMPERSFSSRIHRRAPGVTRPWEGAKGHTVSLYEGAARRGWPRGRNRAQPPLPMAQLLPLFLVFEGQAGLSPLPRPAPPGGVSKARAAGREALPGKCRKARRIPAEVYLAAAELGPVLVDKVKRGPDKGAGGWMRCVARYILGALGAQRGRGARQRPAAGGAGRHPGTGRRTAAPDRFRRLFQEAEGG